MAGLCLFGILLPLILLGVPVGTALGTAGIITLFTFDLGGQMVGTNFVATIASFPLLAIPFFILAGVIMERAGMAARIAGFFKLLVGEVVGGMGMVAVLTCMFWGALSGSGPATTAAVGMILIAPMAESGYDQYFAAATIAAAADLSIVIPPSIAFIIYGSITGVSVSALFMAGVIPGILIGTGMTVVAWNTARHRGWRGSRSEKRSWRDLLQALGRAFWALLAPVIILGGIYSGVFTPTEAAVVAVFYSLLVALVFERSLQWRQLPRIFADAAVGSSVILFLVAFAGIFSWAVSTIGLTDQAATLILRWSPNALIMILLINLLLLGMGMFLDAISISYLVMPILIPVLARFHLDPLWYGVVFITALAIGQATPPVGVNLFTAANLIKGEVDGVSRYIFPYILINVAALVVLSIFPELSLCLPVHLGLYTPIP